MIAKQLNELELEEFVLESDPSLRVKAALPLADTPGTESLGVVYFEIDPGEALMIHTDSRDEIVVLLSGSGLGKVGNEISELTAGGMVFIPAMVPHGFRNIGNETLRAVGVFAGADFESEELPAEQQVFDQQAPIAQD
jgi:mannose-6-phosphate isomerase-like protein (cupin superfamily)